MMMSRLLGILRIPLLTVTFAAAAVPAISCAQDATQPAPVQGNRAGARLQAGQRLQQIIGKLDLSDEQKAKLAPVMDELRTQIRTAMQSSAAPADRREQIREATAAARKQIRDILTPEQRQQLAELLREQRAAATQPTTQAAARGGMIARMEAIALSLDLTPEQQGQVKDLSNQYTDKVAAMLRDNPGSPRANPQVRAAITEYRSGIIQLLTPEQTEQFNQALEELRPARAAGGAKTKQVKHAQHSANAV